jgi:hypothetical protein
MRPKFFVVLPGSESGSRLRLEWDGDWGTAVFSDENVLPERVESEHAAPGAFVEVETLPCHHAPGKYAHSEALPEFAISPRGLLRKVGAR